MSNRMNFLIIFALSALYSSALGNELKCTESPSLLSTYSSAQLLPLQEKKISYSEPIITYSKLKNRTLELLGAEFRTNTESKLNFIAYLLRYFPINSLVFKDFHHSPSLQRIIPYMNLKLKQLVNDVSFDNCIISGHSAFHEITAFKNVTRLKFTYCITTENDLNEFFKLFSKKVTILILDEIIYLPAVEEHSQFSNTESDSNRNSICANLLMLKKFSEMEHLFFSGIFDFKNFKLNQFNHLQTLGLEHPPSSPVPINSLTSLPQKLKLIKINCPKKYIKLIDYLKLADKNIHIESTFPVQIENGLMKTLEFLLVFTSFNIIFSSLSDESIDKMFSFLASNKSNLSHITKIGVVLDLSNKRWNQFLQLIALLPGLQSLELLFEDASEQSIQLPLSNGLITAINDLRIYFPSLNENEAVALDNEYKMSSIVYCLLAMMPQLKSLDFLYKKTNTFVSQLLQQESLPVINLDKYTATYMSNDVILIQNDLNLSQKFNAKQLVFMNHNAELNLSDDASDLNEMQNFSIKTLVLDLWYVSDSSLGTIEKLIEKVPYVEELHVSHISHKILTEMNLQKLRYLRKITITEEYTIEEVENFFIILPLQIQIVELLSYSNFKRKTLELFRKRFSSAILSFDKMD